MNELGTGINLTPEKLQQLAMNFDPFPALKAVDQVAAGAGAPGMGGALGSGITPPAGGFGDMVNGSPAKPGAAPLGPDAIRQMQAMMTPRPAAAPPATVQPRNPQIQTTQIGRPAAPMGQAPTLAQLIGGR